MYTTPERRTVSPARSGASASLVRGGEDNLRKDNYIYGQGYPEGIEEAVHRFAAKTASKVFLAQLEDILHVEKMQNLPGTDKEHPNWRRKLPVTLEKLEGDIAYIRNIQAIRRER